MHALREQGATINQNTDIGSIKKSGHNIQNIVTRLTLSMPVDYNNNSIKKTNQQSDTIQQKQRKKSLNYKFVEIPPHSLTNLYMPRLIWISEESLAVLRHQGLISVDGTFCCVPAEFAQCIIIMAWVAAFQTFVLCVWALVTGKSKYLYCKYINNGCLAAEESIIAGCYFHFQQALLRKMNKFQIPKLECEECSKNIYILTIVPINEINIAIKFIQTNEELKHEN
ncbi:hypothetical protein MXB_4164 [Myxobolus squamalis]|nr:hypothetical protein MXB_4164 [Myxobolus squamalis]